MSNEVLKSIYERRSVKKYTDKPVPAEILGNPDADPFYGAPTVVVVLSDSNRFTYVEDGSLVMGNLMLAAHEMGIGSCWIHRAQQMFDSAEGKELLKKWGLPENLKGVGTCILGYPDEDPAPKPRAEGRVEIFKEIEL